MTKACCVCGLVKPRAGETYNGKLLCRECIDYMNGMGAHKGAPVQKEMVMGLVVHCPDCGLRLAADELCRHRPGGICLTKMSQAVKGEHPNRMISAAELETRTAEQRRRNGFKHLRGKAR